MKPPTESNTLPKAMVIGGTHSGCGKTLVSLALMAALVRQGHVVQPFKVGPDFIDPGWHERVTGRPSHNLDGWMLGREEVVSLFHRYAGDADIAVIEGVMGLYDGASATEEEGSTAQVAKWLDADLALVVDARSMARSAAALVEGFVSFDRELRFSHVLFNRVGSANHVDLLTEAVHSRNLAGSPQVVCLGRDEKLQLPARHLGLVTVQDHQLPKDLLTAMADWIEDRLDLQGLLGREPRKSAPRQSEPAEAKTNVRIGVARDQAFCFYYHENLRLLHQAGAELVFFSPLEQESLPSGLGGLYFGGGYPELHAEALADNASLRAEIAAFSRAGGPVYAECGGFMYLMRSLRTEAGDMPMAGVFAMDCRMLDRRKSLGYRQVTTNKTSVLGSGSTTCRGHEFHYSEPVNLDPEARTLYEVQNRKGETMVPEGFVKHNTLGSYIHLHFAGNPSMAEAFVAASREFAGHA